MCYIERAFVDEFGLVSLTGDHEEGKSNADVRKISIFEADMTHIPLEFFMTFPNLRTLSIMQGSLQRIPMLTFCDNLVEFSASGLRVQVSVTL